MVFYLFMCRINWLSFLSLLFKKDILEYKSGLKNYVFLPKQGQIGCGELYLPLSDFSQNKNKIFTPISLLLLFFFIKI